MHRNMPYKFLILVLLIWICNPGRGTIPSDQSSDEKPILIVTTDIGGDPDDRQSETGTTVEKTRRQPAQASITESSVVFRAFYVFQRQAEPLLDRRR